MLCLGILFILNKSDRSKASNKYQSAIRKRIFIVSHYFLDIEYIRVCRQKPVDSFTCISHVKLLYTRSILMEVYTRIKICP